MSNSNTSRRSRHNTAWCGCVLGALLIAGCTPGDYRRKADRYVDGIIESKQIQALGRNEPFTIEKPADTLRRRLMEAQKLARSHAASLGITDLKPIEHWPDDNYLEQGVGESDGLLVIEPGVALKLTLRDALRVAAGNSRDYQTQKENVYRAALALDLERDAFRTTFTAVTTTSISHDASVSPEVSGIDSTTNLGLTQRFKNGVTLTGAITLDVVKLLSQDRSSSNALSADTSVEIPLLRGSGAHIVAEPLTQAERDALYAIYTFERFKRTFAVSIASDYMAVLQQIDRVKNEEDNYRGLILTVRQIRRESQAGRQSQIEVDRALQDELRARQRWISSQQSYERGLDSFKVTLGLPTDADVELDRDELIRLADGVRESLLPRRDPLATTDEALPADAPVTLVALSRKGAGPMELEVPVATDTALQNRLDLRIAQGRVYDAQRGVVVAADALRAELTLLGRASAGERRSLSSAGSADSFDPRVDEGFYDALLTIDLPLERTRERNVYRLSLINLQRAVRDLQASEDQVKLNVRNILRDLLEFRESLHIQAGAVELAEERVRSTNMLLQAGRGSIRNALDAKDSLVLSQNSLTAALVSYLIAELEIQRDMGVLEVNEQGLWKTYNPQEVPDDSDTNNND
jgi:outer membrane protein TolC